MGFHPLSFFSSLATLIFFIFSGNPCCLSNPELYRSCSYQPSCGNITIKYPFWGQDRVFDCGIPELQVACDKDVAAINLKNVSYRVLDIDYSSQVLKIARLDFLDGVCAPKFVNTSLDPAVFENLNEYTNITFRYGCVPGVFPALSFFICAVSGSAQTTGYIMEGAVGPGTCYQSVYFPISLSAVAEAIRNWMTAEQVSSEGFEAKWKVDNTACSECVKSQGACGYNPETGKTVCYCSNGSGKCSSSLSPETAPVNPGKGSRRKLVIGLSIAAGAAIVIITAAWLIYLCFPSFWRGKTIGRGRKNTNHKHMEAFIRNYDSLIPKRYSYSEIKRMTNSFKEKLGEGGFGSVYKGKLQNGEAVAVKISRESKRDGTDFINEVASFCRTSHVNVIRLEGFCYEETRRALIYEYMSNGSLDKFISDQRSPPHENHFKWDKLYEIAIGIARGLEYLHRGCSTRIVHFDIKPHNILLDEDFSPKISDFGMAKLSKTRESRVSMLDARGTIGYIAPEVIYRSFGEVSHRADVYSYGMMVLEIIGARNRITVDTSEAYFPDWIYDHIESVGVSGLHEFFSSGNAKDLDDDSDDEERIKKMVIVGLWCIQMNPSDRPSMTKVVEMLEGSLQFLRVPPRPVLYSTAARLPSTYSSTTSQSTTTISSQVEENSSGDLINSIKP